MKCGGCGSELRTKIVDLPFKVREATIVILKDLAVLQCSACPQYLLEDGVLARVDRMLAQPDSEDELEIVRYAA